jgi:hypothetical protein
MGIDPVHLNRCRPRGASCMTGDQLTGEAGVNPSRRAA